MPSSRLRTLLVGFSWAKFLGPGLPRASQSGCCVIRISSLTFFERRDRSSAAGFVSCSQGTFTPLSSRLFASLLKSCYYP